MRNQIVTLTERFAPAILSQRAHPNRYLALALPGQGLSANLVIVWWLLPLQLAAAYA